MLINKNSSQGYLQLEKLFFIIREEYKKGVNKGVWLMKLIKIAVFASIAALSTASLSPMDQPQKYFKKQGKKIYRKGRQAAQWVENAGQIMLENLSPTCQGKVKSSGFEQSD